MFGHRCRYQPAIGPPTGGGGARPMSPPPELRDSYFPNKGLPGYLQASDVSDVYGAATNSSAVFDHRLPSRNSGGEQLWSRPSVQHVEEAALKTRGLLQFASVMCCKCSCFRWCRYLSHDGQLNVCANREREICPRIKFRVPEPITHK